MSERFADERSRHLWELWLAKKQREAIDKKHHVYSWADAKRDEWMCQPVAPEIERFCATVQREWVRRLRGKP